MGIWATQNRSNDGGRRFSPWPRMEAPYYWGLHHCIIRLLLGNISAKLKLRISQHRSSNISKYRSSNISKHRSSNSKKTILNSGSLVAGGGRGGGIEMGAEIMIKKQWDQDVRKRKKKKRLGRENLRMKAMRH